MSAVAYRNRLAALRWNDVDRGVPSGSGVERNARTVVRPARRPGYWVPHRGEWKRVGAI